MTAPDLDIPLRVASRIYQPGETWADPSTPRPQTQARPLVSPTPTSPTRKERSPMTELEHYRRQTSGTHPTADAAAMDTPAARIRRELAKHRPVNHNGVEIVDPAEALLAEAISTAEAINRDDLGRFAASEPTPEPYRATTGTTGLAPATGQSQSGTVLDRIRASAQRHNDNPHTPAGFEPPAA